MKFQKQIGFLKTIFWSVFIWIVIIFGILLFYLFTLDSDFKGIN